ncbi:5-methylcytosine restriction system specificity protein McrC [Senegalimassilia anaerobia]
MISNTTSTASRANRRILKATALILATSANVDPTRRRALKRCLIYMGDVSDVVTSRIDWKRFRYNRNNSSYLMLLNVCFMVLNGLIPQRDKEHSTRQNA